MRRLKRWSEIVFFSNITPLLRLGSKRPLQAEDLPELPIDLDPRSTVMDESKIDWSTGAKLLVTLHWAARKYWLMPLGFYGLFGLMNLSGPVLVNLFVSRIQNGLNTRGALLEALVFGVGVGLVGLIGGLSIQHYFLRSLRKFQILTNVLNKKIFVHSLALTKEARERIPVGDIVNHMSTDSDSVCEAGNGFADLLYCVVMIAGCVGLLFYYLGSTAWVAVLLLAILAPLTRKVAINFTSFDENLMRWRDRRITLMSQVLSAIRLVKYLVWEKSVADEVSAIRANEIKVRRRIARAELLVTLLYSSIGTLVLFAVLVVYAWRGGVLDAALIFTCISLFALLEDPFSAISRVVFILTSGRVGATRIAKFLTQPSVMRSTVSGSARSVVGFEMQDVSVTLGDNSFRALQSFSLRLSAGSSLAVVGSVGSGKSTLIQVLLGEVPHSGKLRFFNSRGQCVEEFQAGYVPQEAYILNATIRENLTFGCLESNEQDIWSAVEAAALKSDLDQIAGGLDAEIGERGVNLSGGQRQRISLARTVLARPDIVVLDDPLSAVDSHTEALLVERLLEGKWKQTTCVMVTHRLEHLSKFDQIAFLDRGRVLGLGTFDELQAKCPEFTSYIQEAERTHLSASAEVPTPLSENKDSEVLRVTVEEDREYGAVRGGAYIDYIKALGGENLRLRPLIVFLLAVFASAGTALPLLQKAWLAHMTNVSTSGQSSEVGWLNQLAGVPLHGIYVYGILGLVVLAGTLCADLFWMNRGLSAGRSLHDSMLNSVLRAKVRFFDSTPVGRVLQRFSRDMESVDFQLQWCFEHSIKCFAQVLMTLVLIVAALPAVLFPIVPILFVYYRIQKLYRASAREVKRLDSTSRSPRYAHFKETLSGLVVIRAFKRSDWFLNEFYNRLHRNQRMFYGHYMINRWFSVRIPVIGSFVAVVTTLMIVYAVRLEHISAGLAGLLTVYSLSFWGVLNWGVRIWSDVEARMTSLERIKFYSSLPQEVSASSPSTVPTDWPSRGELRFQNVHARYAKHMPLVLKGLNFTARAGSRVGIVGKTGSGKSTIFQALYRFIEIEQGQISIDGTDIVEVPLDRLRRALAIIPQDPTLFLGSVRANLDRYHEHSDAELWRVLDQTALGATVRALPQQLNTELVENGVNLSQGQRQLLCLARALLLKAKIIVLDEATASVDVQTDVAVQRVLRESCVGVTMLIIAHRVGTVQDCDQILEVRAGQLIEPRRRREERHQDRMAEPVFEG